MPTSVSTKLRIPKTLKFFINGKFVRTESGRSFPCYCHQTENLYAHLSRASRKDLRNAVEAAKTAQLAWSGRAAFNRSQILYRAAEMLEGKRREFAEVFRETLGYEEPQAHSAVDAGIEAFIYYAGFADKYAQILGAVNPVSGPHHNFTTPEAVGVVGLIASETFNFGNLVAQISAVLCSGNTLVVLLHGESAWGLGPLAEVFATCDLPAGVVNLLTGDLDELAPQLGSHMEIEALAYAGGDATVFGKLKVLGVPNMKRMIGPMKEPHSLENIASFTEFKTVWHPVGC
mgnify:CR=1 FL=1